MVDCKVVVGVAKSDQEWSQNSTIAAPDMSHRTMITHPAATRTQRKSISQVGDAPARHIKIRFFFVTDHVKMGEMQVEYCPTREMIGGDFVTKPLQQGTLFNKFPADILA